MTLTPEQIESFEALEDDLSGMIAEAMARAWFCGMLHNADKGEDLIDIQQNECRVIYDDVFGKPHPRIDKEPTE